MDRSRAVFAILAMLVSFTAIPAAAQGMTAWSEHLLAIDQALARDEVGKAIRLWHEGHGAALRSRTWIGLVEVGDAAVRIGAQSGAGSSARAMARLAYLGALSRAEAQRSLHGALRVAIAFGELDDDEAAEHCVRVAERVARSQGDPVAVVLVGRTREQLARKVASRQDQLVGR
jgi:hypothetical protein